MTNPPYPLVSTEWLEAHLGNKGLRIIDIRGHVLPASQPPPHYYNHHNDYLTSHIPGAIFVDWVHEITDPADPRHAQIAPPERYEAVMQRCGIGKDSWVVAYDDSRGMFAARLWWSLHYYGHTRALVLDGGWERWTTEGRPTTDIIPNIVPGAFVAQPQTALRKTATDVEGALGQQILLDMRSADEYNGKASRARRAGHIPTAISLPRGELTDAQGKMLPAENLRAKLATLGYQGDEQPVVFYCNAGVSASFGLLAFRAAGYGGGAVYDGSWKDWGNDESKPIE
jgi:thiosulfate/3-mercaptopyruvate sulfurtransferase